MNPAVQASKAKRKLLSQYGDWIEVCSLVLGDTGIRLEVSVKRGGRAYMPREIDGVPVVIR